MSSSMSVSEQFCLFEDSSSSDDSDIDHTVLIIAVKDLQDRLRMKEATRIGAWSCLHPTEPALGYAARIVRLFCRGTDIFVLLLP
jgi:hypothetical protein